MRKPTSFPRIVLAEFCKMWSFRFSLYGMVGVAVFTSLVSVDLLGGEHLRSHVALDSWNAYVPYLFFASWEKLLAIQLFLMVLGTYCIAVDSQYGMVRAGCTFPFSRADYANARVVAILLHTCLVITVYVAVLLGWSAAVTTARTGTPIALQALLAFYLRLLLFSLCFVWLVCGIALLRRTLLEAFVTVLLAIIVWLFLNFMPSNAHLAGLLSFRYLYYPLATILPNSRWLADLPNMREPMWLFVAANAAPAALVYLFALLRFSRRDILE